MSVERQADKNEELRQARIALVEDDDGIRELVSMNLEADNFAVETFFSIEQCEKNGTDLQNYDLIILDIMLPGQSGLSWAKSLQDRDIMVPILFISALSQAETIQEAYRHGAIDYITKPFDIEVLLAKIRNLLFYFVKREEAPLPKRIGIATIDWDLMEVANKDGAHKLSLRETEVLVHFIKNPGRVVSRRDLIDELWGEKVYISERNIDNFIVKFRRLFEKDPAKPEFFVTYPKKGYAFRVQDDS